jgi:hypothetical protein
MLYTLGPVSQESGPVVLYFSPHDAKVAAAPEQKLLGVSVHYDALMHRLIPVASAQREAGRDWSTPAAHQPDGRIVAQGPIPAPLLFGWHPDG